MTSFLQRIKSRLPSKESLTYLRFYPKEIRANTLFVYWKDYPGETCLNELQTALHSLGETFELIFCNEETASYKEVARHASKATILLTNVGFGKAFIKKKGQLFYLFHSKKFTAPQTLQGFGLEQKNLLACDGFIGNDLQQLQKVYQQFGVSGISKTRFVPLSLNSLATFIQTPCLSSYETNDNGKENVLIYPYKLDDNGITTSLLNLLNQVNLKERNYILFLQENIVSEKHTYKLANLPKGVFVYHFSGKIVSNWQELLAMTRYVYQRKNCSKKLDCCIETIMHREIKRVLQGIPLTAFIHYTGYDWTYATWMGVLQKSGVETSIFVHTDMSKEYQLNKSLNRRIIENGYHKASHVACVSATVEKTILSMNPSLKNTLVTSVFFNQEKIRQKSKLPLRESLKNVAILHGKNLEHLLKELNNPTYSTFINIGRFSKQKAQTRLVKAFEQLSDPASNARLIIVGTYGSEKETLLEEVNNSPQKEKITILSVIENPYPLLMSCDTFVLSSLYEGMGGMVVLEALALGKSVISVDLAETKELVREDKAVLFVPQTVQGLAQAMTNSLSENSSQTDFDFGLFNQNSERKWEKLFSKKRS